MARQALLLERTADSKADAPVDADQRARAWQEQCELARRCRACPLFAHATQTVWGEGPIGAPLMLVGEQPGDQEDLQGRPFVGPAGRLLDRALAELGWDRSVAYVTNAVKHFKWVPAPRGKRRMHKTPAQREADACEPWLEREIALVRPQALVALGATASRQVLKRPVAVLRERGRWLDRWVETQRLPAAIRLTGGGDAWPGLVVRTVIDASGRCAAENNEETIGCGT